MQPSQGTDPHKETTPQRAQNGEVREKNAPPMFEAAIPVLAVTEITAGSFTCFLLSEEIMALSSSDFPVPGQPKMPDKRLKTGWRDDCECVAHLQPR